MGGAGAAVLGLALGAAAYFALARPFTVAPRLGPAPAFALVGSDGHPATYRELEGRPALFAFFPADEADPTARAMAASLAELQRWLQEQPQLPGRLQLVTITVHPEQDTPDRLEAFARKVGADPGVWRFLTGSSLAVKLAVGTGFGVFYERQPAAGGYRVAYEPRYVLVDEVGILRGVYRGPHLDRRAFERDLKLVEQEARARGARRLAYEAAHLFLCYPP